MAKQNLLPSVDASATPATNGHSTVAPAAEGWRPRRLDVKLRGAHREIFHAKLRQLQDAGATLKDGTEVSDPTKAVLWILENEVQV